MYLGIGMKNGSGEPLSKREATPLDPRAFTRITRSGRLFLVVTWMDANQKKKE